MLLVGEFDFLTDSLTYRYTSHRDKQMHTDLSHVVALIFFVFLRKQMFTVGREPKTLFEVALGEVAVILKLAQKPDSHAPYLTPARNYRNRSHISMLNLRIETYPRTHTAKYH